MTEKTYNDLTAKQQAVIDAIEEIGEPDYQKTDVAETAGVAPSYIYYVESEFTELVEAAIGAELPTKCPSCGKEFEERRQLAGHVNKPDTDCEWETDDDEVESPKGRQYEYGPEAQLGRTMSSLTDKQRNTVQAIANDMTGNQAEIARRANVSDSYVEYCETQFPHLINDVLGATQVAADGGEATYDVRLRATDAWRAIRLLPEELSETIYNQIRTQ